MATLTRAFVTPEVLRWARESIGFDVDDAADQIKVKSEKLKAAEAGEGMLTLRQAERAARLYDRPLATLFLPQPPEEEAQDAQFRRLPGAPEPPWPPAMQVLVRRVRERQDAAINLHEALEDTPVWPAALKDLRLVDVPLPELARQVLGIDLQEQAEWHDPSGYVPLRRWIDAIESLGVLVMQDGTLSVETMRGFASMDAIVPAIVVNAKDDARARVFTIIHEFGHLYLAALGRAVGTQTEVWCDDFAGEVLMPGAAVERFLGADQGQNLVGTIDRLALEFGVTPYAAAVRVSKAELWARDDIEHVIAEIRAREPRTRGAGGDYYWTKIGRLGPSFIRLVFNALDSQAVTYPVASSLLDGTKVTHFDKLRDYIGQRTQEP